QCYFIAYGGKLQCDISYHGKELMAKRAGGVLKVTASAIYETDEFEFEVDADTGIKKIKNHKMTLDSIGDGTKIKGAYAVVDYVDGRKEVTIMTKAQILNAWNQRKGNGLTAAHTKFTDEMACKTVRNRALKHAASTSDDAHLFEDMDENEVKTPVATGPKAESQSFDFDDHEEVESKLEAPKENPIENLSKEKEAEKQAASPKPQAKAEQMEAPFA
ncbi:MAG TPA: recombinase RecT, partial [Algoriphagus sp.]|nr:recombinase RecT [Algoriphagus sp.]